MPETPALPDDTKEMKHVPWVCKHEGHDPTDPRVYTVESLAMVMCGYCSEGALRWRYPGSETEWGHAEPFGYDADECEAGHMLAAAVELGIPIYTGADLEFSEDE